MVSFKEFFLNEEMKRLFFRAFSLLHFFKTLYPAAAVPSRSYHLKTGPATLTSLTAFA